MPCSRGVRCFCYPATNLNPAYKRACDQKDIAAYPTVAVVLQGVNSPSVTLKLSPEAYLNPQSCGNGSTAPCYCLGIVSVPPSDGTILGDVFMQQYTVVFDRANARVGFGDVSC
jgi:hypothetical protein